MKPGHYALLAVISYLLFTLVTFPAAAIYKLVDENPAFKIYGIEGSIWNGQADSVSIPRKPSLNQIQWSINPFSLLLLAVSADFEAQLNNNPILANIRMGISGNMEINDLKTSIAASELARLASLPLGEFDGDVYLNIDNLSLADQPIPEISGSIIWQNAKLTLTETVDLGRLNIRLSPQTNGDLVAKITSDKGQIDISGEASIAQNKAYKLDIMLTPKSDTSPSITQSLGFFAKRQSNGSYRVKQNGNLNQFGF